MSHIGPQKTKFTKISFKRKFPFNNRRKTISGKHLGLTCRITKTTKSTVRLIIFLAKCIHFAKKIISLTVDFVVLVILHVSPKCLPDIVFLLLLNSSIRF